MNKDLVFIVSAGRTGTTFFGNVLSDMIDDAFSVHEPDVFSLRRRDILPQRIRAFGLWHMVFGRVLGRTGIRNLTKRRLAGRIKNNEKLLDAIRAHRERYYNSLDENLIIESNSQWYGLLPQIREVFPKSKVVGIVRDPRDWVVSWLQHGGHHDRHDLVARFGQKRLSPGMLGEAELARQWASMTPFERHCWDWRTVYREVTAFCEQDRNSRLYRYEDLFLSEDASKIRDLVEFVVKWPSGRYQYRFEPEMMNRRINSSDGYELKWTEWNSERAKRLAEFCSPLMERFGYGQEPEWRAMLEGSNSMARQD